MARTIYAFLVAIDEYFPPVTNLGGCKNDIQAVAEVLRSRAEAAGDQLELRSLTDRDATREGVIAALREHLGQAGPEDAALFYYSGHGSQEDAPPELWHLEPDRRNETLVCADSRTPGNWDLADKELGALLGDVADGGAHVTAVLDCCHSGSGTRGAAVGGEAVERRFEADHRERPLSTYLSGVAASTRSVGDDGAAAGRRLVTLSACRSDQTAKERMLDGARRGVFSTSLVTLLRGGPLTYRDLHRAALASASNLADDQTPVLEVRGAGDVDESFLGGLAAPPPHPFTVSRRHDVWMLDGGRVHGVVEGSQVALFPLVEGDAPVTTGVVTTVQPVRSVVVPDDGSALDPDLTYRVSLTGGAPGTPVALHGPPDRLGAAREALHTRSGLVREDPDGAELALRSTADGWRITAADSTAPLVADVPDPSTAGAVLAVARLEHIARWRALLARRNPASTIPAAAALLDVTSAPPGGRDLLTSRDGEHGTVEVTVPPGRTGAPVQVRVRNGSDRLLYYGLLGLTEAYGVVSLLPGGGVWLGPGEEAWVLDSDGEPRLTMTLPDGATRTRDVLKLVVSTAEFDAQNLAQPELPPPRVTRGGDRGFSLEAPPALTTEDWRTGEAVVETVRGET